MNDDPTPVTSAARVFGWLLTVFGGLWVLLTGGCTLTLMTVMAGEVGRDLNAGMQMFLMYLVIGAVCVAPGAGLLIWGLLLLRKPREPRA